MRSFIAIELPDSVREALSGLRDRFRRSGASASWVKEDNMHLTLRFLGDFPEQEIEGLSEQLVRVCAVRAPIQVRIHGVGAFPNLRKPNVVWAGVEVLGGELLPLQAEIEKSVQAFGMPPEDKTFHPHITLGRLRDSRRLGDLPADLVSAQSFAAGDFFAENVALFSSTLTPHGPLYRRIWEFSLACR